VGDGANTGTPKAGVFAEGAAKAVASALIAKLMNGAAAREYDVLALAISNLAAAASVRRKWISFPARSRPELLRALG
jgi:hypothetical protein